MKLPKVMDADDVGIIAQGFVFAALIFIGVLTIAILMGLAWTVFRLAGGL